MSRRALAAAAVAGGLMLMTQAPAFADDFMDQVKAEVVKFAGPQSDWRGPTSAPKPDAGKQIVYMSSDEQNDASREWGQAIAEAGAKIGWKVTIIDGHGSAGRLAAGHQPGDRAQGRRHRHLRRRREPARTRSRTANAKGISRGRHPRRPACPARSPTSACSSTSSRTRARSAGPRPTGSSRIPTARRAWS